MGTGLIAAERIRMRRVTRRRWTIGLSLMVLAALTVAAGVVMALFEFSEGQRAMEVAGSGVALWWLGFFWCRE